jgi:predicted ribosome quality control (RQC) complex YloA/Tae2 family protein
VAVRIPFDNVALSAIVSELSDFVGSTIQEVRQPDEHTVTIKLYQRGMEGVFLLSVHPQFARAHFTTRRLPNLPTPPVLCATLRSRLIGCQLVGVEQIASDRVLVLSFSSEEEPHRLVTELMGKHSNMMLLDHRNFLVAAAKWVPGSKSSRPILPATEYLWPPVLDGSLVDVASPRTPAEWLSFASEHPSRLSPFFRSLAPTVSIDSGWSPCLVVESGAYPIDVKPLGLSAFPRQTLSTALEQFFANAEAAFEVESLRSNLLGQIDRVITGRQVAIAEIEDTLRVGAQADRWQQLGQLILAYGAAARPGVSFLEAWDYQGEPVRIEVNPELSFVENSNAYFERAKKAKARVVHLQENLERLQRDLLEALRFRQSVLQATKQTEFGELQQLAKTRRWSAQQVVAKSKDERPFEGHRIRELLGPGGVRVLFGENAESNDYLTLRVAKPNDYWLHVRGSTSAHVVLVTGNEPTRIQKEQLMFAAKVAVLNSGSKHAGYVPVDYTLKKYVRKPKGAAKGSALYTNEKTLHVES